MAFYINLNMILHSMEFMSMYMSNREPTRWQHNRIYPHPKSLRVNARIVSRPLLTAWYCCLFTSFMQRVMGHVGAEDICDYAAIKWGLGHSLSMDLPLWPLVFRLSEKSVLLAFISVFITLVDTFVWLIQQKAYYINTLYKLYIYIIFSKLISYSIFKINILT